MAVISARRRSRILQAEEFRHIKEPSSERRHSNIVSLHSQAHSISFQVSRYFLLSSITPHTVQQPNKTHSLQIALPTLAEP